MSLGIFEAAADVPERLALITPYETRSFAELAEGALRAIAFLDEQGVTAQSPRPVAVTARSTPSIVELLHALIAIGAPALLVHPRLTASERARLLGTEPATLVVDSSWSHSGATPQPPPTPPTDDRPLAIVLTSGTTGTPTRVTLSRAALVSAATASEERLGSQDDDRWLGCLPLAHVGGLSILIRCLLARRTMVLAEDSEPASLLALARRERVTLASFVPTQLTRLLDDPGFSALPSLRAALIGGAAASPTLIARARQRGMPALATYGLTEACGQVATQRLGDPDTASVGPPLVGVEVRLLEQGRIAIRGPTLATGLSLVDGWYVTDDLGSFDARGRLSIIGRASDRIVTGGENVDPLEIELALDRCPGVTRACVFGVGDALWGQRVAVAVVGGVGFEHRALAAFCERELASFKRPRLCAQVSELCHRPNGKLDRRATAAAALARLQPL